MAEFTSYFKTASSPTVYGTTGSGQTVAFENEQQFLGSGGQWGNIKTVQQSPVGAVSYSQYSAPKISPSVVSSSDARTITNQNMSTLGNIQMGYAQSQAQTTPAPTPSSTPQTPTFYKPVENNPTVFNAQGQALPYDQYIAQGGKPDFSNVISGTPPTQLSTTGVTDPALLASIKGLNEKLSTGQYPEATADANILNNLGIAESNLAAEAQQAATSKDYLTLDGILGQYQEIQKQRSKLIEKITASMQATDEEKTLSSQISELTNQGRNIELSAQAGLNQTEQQLTPMKFIAGDSERLIKEANLKLQTIAAQQAPLIDRLSIAQSTRLDGIKTLEFALQNLGSDADMLLKISSFAQELEQVAKEEQKSAQEFALKYAINKPFYNVGGTIYRTNDGKAYSSVEQARQDGVDVVGGTNVYKVDANSEAVRAMVADWAKEYPDSGILPSDSIEVARTKLQSSGLYQKKISNSSGSSGSGTTGVPQKIRDYESEFEARVDYDQDVSQLAADLKAGTALPPVSQIIQQLVNDYGSKISKQEIQGTIYGLYNVKQPTTSSSSSNTAIPGATKLYSQEGYKQSQQTSQLDQYKQRASEIIAKYKASKDSSERVRLKNELATIPQKYNGEIVHNGL